VAAPHQEQALTSGAAPAPRLSPCWSQVGRCPACGLAISVDAAGVPNGPHVGSRLCLELAAERAAAPKPQPEEPDADR